jgi:NAD-dependent dihydropyrimidine dehydrogenase PreA subunit
VEAGNLGIKNLQANMTRIIDENKCSRCGVCVLECPNQAFVMTEDAYVISPDLCNDCAHHGGSICEDICPSKAIHELKFSLYQRCLNKYTDKNVRHSL